MDSSVPSCFLLNNYQVTSQSTDTTGLNSAQALEHVNTESAGNHQASSGFHPFFKLQQPTLEKFNAGLTDPSFPGPISDDYQGNFPIILGVDFASLTSADTNVVLPEKENLILGDLVISNFGETWEFGNHPQIQKECQTSEGTSRFSEQVVNLDEQLNFLGPCLPQTDEQEIHPMQNNLQVQLSDADHGSLLEETLKKLDSFNRWMSKELGDVNEAHTQSSSEVYWDTVESENRADESNISPHVHLDNYTLGPSLSQDQLFSIIDFSPNWASEGSKVKASVGKWYLDQNVHAESVYGVNSRFNEQDGNWVKLLNSREPFLPKTDKQDNDPMRSNLQVQLSDADHGYYLKSNPEINMALEGKTNSSFTIKKTGLDGSLMEENLKKLDSFNRWMSKELGDVNESHTQSSSEVYWDTVENENRADESNISPQVHLDNYTLSPSLSQDQLFSIIDFSPNWAYEGSEVKVLITGRFLKSQQEIENCMWSCMFGEVEVPAEVIADGVIRCHTPVHKAARVPFYVTCSNRVACSEVREFEYRVSLIEDMDIMDNSGNTNDDLLMRFKIFLSLTSAGALSTDSVIGREKSQVSSKISSLLEGDNDEWDQMLKLASEKDFSPEKVQDKLLEKLLKEKLHVWLLQKAAEDGKGPSVVDEDGQGVLHFAAALGYDWALEPTIIAGVSVNFRDVNGWTALHWAAFCGRERTVVSLVSLGAAPGALTDPSPKFPSGRTAADLASAEGHKGIAGYLAESHLSTHLSSLKLDTGEGDAAEISGANAVQKVSERSATPVSDGDLPYGLSLKDSLAAVCNASQAFARIYQVFRVESFNKKQLKEYGDDTFGMSDEQALSLLALKTNKSGQHDLPVHAAAIRIQNKFRSWKGRREFLIIRQRIVKIQAHVRGHQVRKNHKKFTWSVGIIGKIILRWRRKGCGLRGFKSEALTEGHRMQDKYSEDDYDFLKEGRKQTEQRLQKALARVKSMAQYPDARDQYRRLLNVVTDIQGSKVVGDGVPRSSEETADYNDEMIDFDAFLEDDTYMSSA
ncbi:calmodulin-binding transcription activator 3-like isoform X2 [Castanea sativa]